MKILKVKFYKRPTVKTGVVRANTGEFTIEQLEDAKRLIEIGIEWHKNRMKNEKPTTSMLQATATKNTVRITLPGPTPQAANAVISLSLYIRPKASNTAI